MVLQAICIGVLYPYCDSIGGDNTAQQNHIRDLTVVNGCSDEYTYIDQAWLNGNLDVATATVREVLPDYELLVIIFATFVFIELLLRLFLRLAHDAYRPQIDEPVPEV